MSARLRGISDKDLYVERMVPPHIEVLTSIIKSINKTCAEFLKCLNVRRIRCFPYVRTQSNQPIEATRSFFWYELTIRGYFFSIVPISFLLFF